MSSSALSAGAPGYAVLLPRVAGPHEVAEVIVFLLSDGASYQSVYVTRGMVTH